MALFSAMARMLRCPCADAALMSAGLSTRFMVRSPHKGQILAAFVHHDGFAGASAVGAGAWAAAGDGEVFAAALVR